MTGITAQQSKLLAFIEECQREKGVTPSYREMAAHVGLASMSSISKLIEELQSRGRIKCSPRRARSIEIVRKQCPHCGGSL